MKNSTNSKRHKKVPKSSGNKKSVNVNPKSKNIPTGLVDKSKSRRRHPPLLSEPLADDIQAEIAERAHELFEQRGRVHGDDWQDWLKAEQEILGEHPRYEH